MGISNNIKRLREYYDLSQQDLADIANVTDKAVSTWEVGTKTPRMGAIEKISMHFNIPKSAIVDDFDEYVKEKRSHLKSGHDDRLVAATEKKGVKIPVLGSIPAGIPIEAIEDIIDYEEIPESWTRGGNEYFALKIKGESMMPEYRDKDTVIFKKQDTCDNNDDCAVMLNGNEATFKRVERLMEGVILKPLNPAFESKFYSNKEIEELPVRVIGVFWELRRGRAVK